MKRNLTLTFALVVLVLLAFGLTQKSHAQSFRFGLDGGLAAPMFDYSDAVGPGFAIHASAKFVVFNKLGIGLLYGYQRVSREQNGVTNSISVQPLNVSLDYAFLPGFIHPYIGLDGGLFFRRNALDFLGNTFSDSDSEFGLAPNVGVRVDIGDKFGVNVNGRLQWIAIENADDYYAAFLMAGVYYRLGL